MDKQAEELLAVLRNPNVDNNIKLDLLGKIKAFVKHRAVPENAVHPTFEVIRHTLRDQALQDSGYSLLSHLTRRMNLQGQQELLADLCVHILSDIVDCISDSKDRVQQRAIQCLVDIWEICPAEVENAARETIIGGRSRAKIGAMQWVVKMHQSTGFKFKPFVPAIVHSLKEVANVAERAKHVLIKLFENAGDAAKNDLQKEMTSQQVSLIVREDIFTKIGYRPRSSGIGFPRSPSSSSNRPISSSSNRPRSSFSHTHSAMRSASQNRPKSAASSRSGTRGAPSTKVTSAQDGDLASSTKMLKHKKSISASSSHKKDDAPLSNNFGDSIVDTDSKKQKRPMSAVPAMNTDEALPPPVNPTTKVELDPTKPIHIQPNGTFFLSKHLTTDHKDITARLDEQCRDMAEIFDGKEGEHNWMAREKNLIIMRKITKGNAPNEFISAYIAMIRGNLDGIVKSVNSLRTTVSSHGCFLVQEAARAVGPGLDLTVEILMQTLIKLCGHTKTINAQNGNTTITVLFSNVTYKTPLLAHVMNACGDKNVRPRLFAQGWLKTIIARHINHKHSLEHGNGVETMEKILNRGLGDADPGVRESARDAYWSFATIWPTRAENIIVKLKPAAQNQLLQHPSNPKPIAQTPGVEDSKPKTMSRTTATASRSNLKEVMAAKKKEKAQLESQSSKPKDVSVQKDQLPQKVLIQQKTVSSTGSLSSAPLRPMRSKSALKKTETAPKAPHSSGGPKPKSTRDSPSENRDPSIPEPVIISESSNSLGVDACVDVGPFTKTQQIEDPEYSLTGASSPPMEAVETDSLPLKQLENRPKLLEETFVINQNDAEKQRKNRNVSPQIDQVHMLREQRQHLSELSESRTNNGNVSDSNTVSLIESGIKRINTNTLDAHGYRKLRATVSSNLETLEEEKLRLLVSAILPKLGDLSSTFDDRIVMQQNILLCILVQGRRKIFIEDIPEVLRTIVLALSRYTDQSHVASTLSTSLLDLIKDSELPAADCLEALNKLYKEKQLSLYGRTQCLAATGSIVTKHIEFGGNDGNDGLLKHVLSEASNAMSDMDASLRRCGNLVAAACFYKTDDEKKFWDVFGAIGKADKTMLLYTIRQQSKS